MLEEDSRGIARGMKKKVEKERRRQRGCGDDDIENSVLQFRGARGVRLSNA